jgi:hypothetical protein
MQLEASEEVNRLLLCFFSHRGRYVFHSKIVPRMALCCEQLPKRR